MTDRHAKTSATRTARIRAQIVAAAKPLLDARSPHDLTFVKIAKAARFTTETVEKHFPHLSNLTIEVYLHPIGEMCERIMQEREHTTRSRLTLLIVELATLFAKHPSLAAALMEELQRTANDQHPTCKSLLRGTERWLNAFRTCKNEEDSRQRAVDLLRAVSQWTSKHFQRDEAPNTELIEARAHRTVTDLGR